MTRSFDGLAGAYRVVTVSRSSFGRHHAICVLVPHSSHTSLRRQRKPAAILGAQTFISPTNRIDSENEFRRFLETGKLVDINIECDAGAYIARNRPKKRCFPDWSLDDRCYKPTAIPQLFEQTRRNLLGRAFQYDNVIWPLARLARRHIASYDRRVADAGLDKPSLGTPCKFRIAFQAHNRFGEAG